MGVVIQAKALPARNQILRLKMAKGGRFGPIEPRSSPFLWSRAVAPLPWGRKLPDLRQLPWLEHQPLYKESSKSRSWSEHRDPTIAWVAFPFGFNLNDSPKKVATGKTHTKLRPLLLNPGTALINNLYSLANTFINSPRDLFFFR